MQNIFLQNISFGDCKILFAIYLKESYLQYFDFKFWKRPSANNYLRNVSFHDSEILLAILLAIIINVTFFGFNICKHQYVNECLTKYFFKKMKYCQELI